MTNRFYAYVRTSTIKQGTEGVSLDAQRDAISAYAQNHKLEIIDWFSETQSAAKRGRPVFNKMMKALAKRRVDGLILHRIDRGSRNLRDWSDIADLSDLGLKVHFAHDGIDLTTRGGRLAADVQAVVAADFVRNLREETRKGILGRLKQGYFPFGAPVGYLDQGKAKAKIIDPIKGPLVKIAFELYASGQHNFHSLRIELHRLGLRTAKDEPISLQGLTTMLTNPFYVGLMRLRSTGELFTGLHKPLLSQEVFDCAQDVRLGRISHRGLRHTHLFRRDIACETCTYKLIGETQKGHVYYRCHTRACPKTALKEEVVAQAMQEDLNSVLYVMDICPDLPDILVEAIEDLRKDSSQAIAALSLQRVNLTTRLDAATDAVIEGLIDKADYVERKSNILRNRHALDEQVNKYAAGELPEADNARRYLELTNRLRHTAFRESSLAAREVCRPITSNFVASGKSVTLQWNPPFDALISYAKAASCDPTAGTRRTSMDLARLLMPTIKVPTSPCPRVQRPVAKQRVHRNGRPVLPGAQE